MVCVYIYVFPYSFISDICFFASCRGKTILFQCSKIGFVILVCHYVIAVFLFSCFVVACFKAFRTIFKMFLTFLSECSIFSLYLVCFTLVTHHVVPICCIEVKYSFVYFIYFSPLVAFLLNVCAVIAHGQATCLFIYFTSLMTPK